MQKNKALVSLVFGLGIILIAGMMLLIYGFYQRATDPEFKLFKSSAPTTADISIPLPPGYRVHTVTASEENLHVHITNADKPDRILILDAETGEVLRRIQFDSQP